MMLSIKASKSIVKLDLQKWADIVLDCYLVEVSKYVTPGPGAEKYKKKLQSEKQILKNSSTFYLIFGPIFWSVKLVSKKYWEPLEQKIFSFLLGFCILW